MTFIPGGRGRNIWGEERLSQGGRGGALRGMGTHCRENKNSFFQLSKT